MKNGEIYDLLMGVAVVALAYALYTHFKPAAKAKAAPVSPAPPAPQAAGFLPYSSQSLDALLAGTSNDLGAFENKNYLNLLESPVTDWWKK